MSEFRLKGIPIVSLFLSGRPLIVEKELNLSSSFVSIWLPGTAVEGINDVVFSNIDNSINYDFKGRLSFSWPSKNSNNPLNKNLPDYNPMFEYGFGLTYENLNE